MNSHRPVDFRVSEEAALWLQRLNHEDTPEVRAGFSVWIKKAAVNLEEFLFAQAVWKELDHIDPAMVEKLRDAAERPSVVSLGVPAGTREPVAGSNVKRKRLNWPVGIAASMAVILAGWFVLQWLPPGAQLYTTGVGDQQVIKLDDGSVVHLNTGSRIEVRYSGQARTLRLLSGEALFTVERDPARPFHVLTDSARIQALGTQFNVYRTSSTTTRVAVVEGAVQVSRQDKAARQESIKLGAGDEARVDKDRLIKAAAPNVPRAVAWRARRLVFPGDRIADVVEEFNRYNKVQIRVEGEAIRDRRMSGVFDADDPSPFIEHLSRDPDVVVEKRGNEICVRPRER